MKKSAQSKSIPPLQKKKKKKEAVNSIFQQALFALAITRFLHVHEVPSTNLRKGGGWGTSPPLQVQSHTRAREERFCSWRYHLRLSTLHHVNFTEQSQHINSYREKNASQMFAKALVRRRTCSKKGYSTTSSSYEQTDNLGNCKDNPSVSEDGVSKASEMAHWWTDTDVNPVRAPQK